jgi:spermidine/putrescine transport system permease protein
MTKSRGLVVANVIAVAALVFLHAPVLALAVFSFNDSRYGVAWEGFTWRWYERLLERGDLRDGLMNSLFVAAATAAIATVLGTLLALGLARHHFRGRRFIDALLQLPLVTPEIVLGISSLALFALGGVALGFGTIIVAHVAFSLSYVVLVVVARLDGMDRHLEEAAMSLGADEVSAFFKVTLPQLWPGVIGGGLLAFTLSIDDFLVTFFVAGPGSSTLPLVVYPMVRRGIEPSVNAVSTLLVVVTTLAVFVADARLKHPTSARSET